MFRATFVALARYLPVLSLIFFEYDPLASVVVLPTLFQLPGRRALDLDGNARRARSEPVAHADDSLGARCFFSLSVTLLECVLLTVKLVVLVAVPPGAVTLIGPVVAVEGTVAVIWVAEFTTNVAVTLLKVTAVVVNAVP